MIDLDSNTKNLAELVRKLQGGDRSAFDGIYNLTYEKVYFTALKICKNEEDAEDVLQESYIHLMNKVQDLKNSESFMSWFNMIVASRAKNLLRKNNPVLFKDEETEDAVLDSITDEDKDYKPGSDIEQDELKKDVMELVDGLSDDKRTAVILYYYNEMTTRQIAESLGVNENTVKSRLVQAKKDLAKGVKELEKKNRSLFGIAPIPLIIWALRSAAKTTAVPAAAAKIAASTAATAAAAKTGGGLGAKIASWSIRKKVVAGVVAAGIVTGGAVGTKLLIDALNSNTAVEQVYRDGTCGENTKWELEESSGSLRIYGTGAVSDGESIQKYLDDGKVKNVVIEDGITVIETSLFRESDIESVTIPASVTEITGWTFADCKKLKKVHFEKRSDEQAVILGRCMFNGCESLTDINFEDSNALDDESVRAGYRFEGCTSLKEITIPKNHTAVEYCDFNGCSSLETVNIPAGVTLIDVSAFGNCAKLKNVNFGQNSQLTGIGYCAFENCESLESIDIPSGVEEIGHMVFAHCTSLKSISFEQCLQLKTIDVKGFIGCTALESVTLPKNLETLAEEMFYGCTNLKNVDFNQNSYLKSIGDSAFRDCSNLESIDIPSAVTSIGAYVFSGCTSLKNIDFSQDSLLTDIGYMAFSGCTALESVYLPKNVQTLGDFLFSGCENLLKADIPESVTEVSDNIFSDCPKMSSKEKE